jgi:uncharacterized protein (DUF362 family)
MFIEKAPVAILSCLNYELEHLKEIVEGVTRNCFSLNMHGQTVLIKPNLVAGLRNVRLSCTHPNFIVAVVQWCLDHGARVMVGDSPAFGSAKGVMRACGINEALKKLPVRLVNFSKPCQMELAHGITVGIAREVMECDFLINLPKVKAHRQLLVSLAVKNYFGMVVGFRKPLLHARLGDVANHFPAMVVDLLDMAPPGVSIADGIVAMHKEGPTTGVPYSLGVVLASQNPVAIDTALMEILSVNPDRNPILMECRRRNLPGSWLFDIEFPLLLPQEVAVGDFEVPHKLKSVSFHPFRLALGGVKRVVLKMRGK